MEKIKNQVSELVKFKATTFEALEDERHNIHDRILEGIEKMKESKVFSEAEVKDIAQYSGQILHERFTSAKQDITAHIRENFEF